MEDLITIGISMDCAYPARMAAFWCETVEHMPKPPPTGRATWLEYWRRIGMPEDDLGDASQAIETIVDFCVVLADPEGYEFYLS